MDSLQVLVLFAILFTDVILDESPSDSELENQCVQQTNNHESCDSKDQKDASQLGNKDYWGYPNCFAGRHTIVHLFEWKWSDIAAECETFLGPHGYCGVQVSPPNENRVVISPHKRPWWERYQPVSYEIITRSGSDADFTDMVKRCNKANVTIYVDAVINHMTKEEKQGKGTAGSSFEFSDKEISYPVPFSSEHFNGEDKCNTTDLCIHDYKNKYEVRNCRLQGLADLNQEKGDVQKTIAKYMNELISKGVAGFRVDAAKHMWPKDLKAIYKRLDNLKIGNFPDSTKPFIFQEVIDIGSKDEAIHASEYTGIGCVTNFIFGIKLAGIFREKHKAHDAKWLRNWGEAWSMPKSTDVVVFVDNHDNQRGHGAGGGVLTHKDPRLYKMATVFMLAHHYGFARVMSSFSFDSPDQGPPHNEDMSIKDVISGSDTVCGNGWVCEHRWRQIHNMVGFRNVVHGTDMENWWDNGNNQIAFSRGSKGFIAINADNVNLEANLYTALPEDIYCDVISGNYEDCMCTGRGIHVRGDGTAYFHISSSSEDPIVAIHIGAKIGSRKKVTT